LTRKPKTNEDIIKLMNEQHKEKMDKFKEINMHVRRILEISKRIENINERFLPAEKDISPDEQMINERFAKMVYERQQKEIGNEKGN